MNIAVLCTWAGTRKMKEKGGAGAGNFREKLAAEDAFFAYSSLSAPEALQARTQGPAFPDV